MKLIFVLLVAVAMVSCSKQREAAGKVFDGAPTVKISVLSSGRVLSDGREITLPQLDPTLTELKKVGGTVWYYREAGQAEPPPQAMEVIKLVADKGLPVTLSSKPDFSDYVGEDGQSHPRKKWGPNHGELQSQVKSNHYDAFITTDTNLKHQQNLTNRSIHILALTSTSWPRIRKKTDGIRMALEVLGQGGYAEVTI